MKIYNPIQKACKIKRMKKFITPFKTPTYNIGIFLKCTYIIVKKKIEEVPIPILNIHQNCKSRICNVKLIIYIAKFTHKTPHTYNKDQLIDLGLYYTTYNHFN